MNVRSRVVALLLAMLAIVVAGVSLGVTRPGPAEAADCSPMPTNPQPRVTAPASTPYFGVLGTTIADPAGLRRAGVTTVTLAVAWDRVELTPGCVNQAYVAQLRGRYAQYRSAGLDVILDAGLQYVPSWVFNLPGQTRFVNQYGDQWRGNIGADVPDAVFNPAVRAAQGRYIVGLGALLQDLEFRAVRVGGLANNELMYPTKNFNGRTNSFWAFSPDALALSPVPSYRPGSGTSAQARAFIDYYTQSLNNYATWQLDRYRRAFGPTPTNQLLLPSWGVRPNDRAQAENNLLRGNTRGELTGAVNQGLDWVPLAQRVQGLPGRNELYSTWMDAADQGTAVTHTSPMRYIAGIAKPLGLPIGGENTGFNQAPDMKRSVDRVREFGLTGMMWMNEDQLRSGSYATLNDYSTTIGQR